MKRATSTRFLLVGLLGGLAASGLGCASSPGSGTAKAAAAGPSDDDKGTLRIAGPAPFDCDGKREQARAKGQRFAPFLIEVRCRVQPIWTCPGFCQTNRDHYTSEVSASVDRSGQLVASQTKIESGEAAYDELSLAALRAGSPFAAPPAPMVDGTGVVPLTVEFSCDCRR